MVWCKKSLARKMFVGAVLAILPGSAGLWLTCTHAQQPAASPSQINRIHIKSKVFHLPIRIDRGSLPKVREVCLYMKEGQGEWIRKESVPPNIESFRCVVPHDGEFSFAVVTVDLAGNSYPADLNQVAPAMTVVVESQPRDTIIVTEPSPAPLPPPVAPSTTVLDNGPTLGSAMPPPPNPFARSAPAVAASPIGKAPDIQPIPSATPMPQTIQVIPNSSPIPEPTRVAPTVAQSPAPAAPPTVQPLPPPNPAVQPTPAAQAPQTPTTAAAPQPTAPSPSTVPPPSQQNAVQTSAVQQQPPAFTAQPAAIPAPTAAAAPNRQILNTTRVGIDYNVGRAGPSGVSKVEVWASPDQGRTWQRVGEDTDQRSPAEVDLPGEGVYGVRLVGTNGNGFGGKAPVSGDTPSTTIEVDMTNPVIHIFEVDSVSKNGVLDIRYRVTDKNLAHEPINLYYAAQRSGPWLPIAFKAKNEGLFHWSLPRDVPTQLFFRIEAIDVAGNLARNETQNPTMLDMTEPDVNVTGITAMPQRVAGSPGNQ